jgi:hypothetical protein
VASIKDKVQDALDENRMMVLGVQVLIGFDYKAPFEKGFALLPHTAQLLKLTSLSILLVTFALLITPGADHRIGERGEDSAWFHRFTSAFASVALLPFATAIGIDLAIAASRLAGPAGATIAGVSIAMMALFMWYGLELAFRPDKKRREAMKARDEAKQQGPTDVRHKIRHALTEARVVLPGAQALLGFQFITMLMEAFEKLPRSLRWLHFGSLSCMALAIVLLITPAAWHRIVERGEETERTHKVATAMIVAALVPIALGLCGDFLVVSYQVTKSMTVAAWLSGAALAVFAALWFGLTVGRRLASASERSASSGAEVPA